MQKQKSFLKQSLDAAILASALVAVATEAATLKVSHIRPQGASVDEELKAFASKVDEATGGDVKINIFAASALGDYTTVQERISIGAIDMALQPAATGVERRMQITYFPYAAENWEQAREMYGPGGPIYEAIKELYAGQGITMLAAYPVYFGGVALNRDAVAPGDASVEKGIKVRVPEIKSFQLTADSLGYISAPIPFSEAFTAAQTGVVDGLIGSGAEGYYASFRDVTQTYVPVNTHFEAWYMVINSKTFDGLDAEDREALQSEAEAFEAQRWTTAETEQSEYEQKLADYGATIVELSEAEVAKTAEKVRAEVWPELMEDLGEDWVKGVLEKD